MNSILEELYMLLQFQNIRILTAVSSKALWGEKSRPASKFKKFQKSVKDEDPFSYPYLPKLILDDQLKIQLQLRGIDQYENDAKLLSMQDNTRAYEFEPHRDKRTNFRQCQKCNCEPLGPGCRNFSIASLIESV